MGRICEAVSFKAEVEKYLEEGPSRRALKSYYLSYYVARQFAPRKRLLSSSVAPYVWICPSRYKRYKGI